MNHAPSIFTSILNECSQMGLSSNKNEICLNILYLFDQYTLLALDFDSVKFPKILFFSNEVIVVQLKNFLYGSETINCICFFKDWILIVSF